MDLERVSQQLIPFHCLEKSFVFKFCKSKKTPRDGLKLAAVLGVRNLRIEVEGERATFWAVVRSDHAAKKWYEVKLCCVPDMIESGDCACPARCVAQEHYFDRFVLPLLAILFPREAKV